MARTCHGPPPPKSKRRTTATATPATRTTPPTTRSAPARAVKAVPAATSIASRLRKRREPNIVDSSTALPLPKRPRRQEASKSSSDSEQHSDANPEADSEQTMPEARNSQPAQRGKVNKKKSKVSILPPPNVTLEFTNSAHQARFEEIKGNTLTPNKSLHIATMEELGVLDAVRKAFAVIGWSHWFDMIDPAYYELVYEFYASFEFDKNAAVDVNAPGVVSFRLLNNTHSMSITEFNVALGALDARDVDSPSYLGAFCDYPADFNPLHFYRELTGDTTSSFSPGKSKANNITADHLRYIHRFLASSFSVRVNGTNVVTKCELFFLWCMVHEHRVNFGFWLACQFSSVFSGNSRPLILGSFITVLARSLGEVDFSRLTFGCPLLALDMTRLSAMHIINGSEEGNRCFIPAGALEQGARRQAMPAGNSQPINNARLEPRLQSMERKMDKLVDLHCGLLKAMQGLVDLLTRLTATTEDVEEAT